MLFLLVSCGGAGHESAKPRPKPVRIEPLQAELYRAGGTEFEVIELVTGLERPWALAFLPDGGVLVTERPGRLRVIPREGEVSAPISGLPRIFVDGQAGLLDVALSPAFERDGLVYVSFAESNFRGNLAGTAVARGRLDGLALRDVEVIYRQTPKRSSGTHVGSRLVFDDDGNLFVTQGDHRVAAAEAQQLDTLVGKIVRVAPDGTVPPDNPFLGIDGALEEIWSYGHRNVQGAALHPGSRLLWISEHGPMGGDELNIAVGGLNYGWPLVTHGRDYSGRSVEGSVGHEAVGMEPPHHVWQVSPAVSGMAFYEGSAFPAWSGSLFVAALDRRGLIRLTLAGDRIVGEERLLGDRGQRYRDVRSGPDGALYLLVDDDDGSLLRLQPVAEDAAAP